MTDFRFLKLVEENDGGVKLKRLFHASPYQGGLILRTTTIMGGKTVASNMLNLPMAEIYEVEKGKLDIRMVTFNLQQIGMDIGFDLGGGGAPTPTPEEQKGPDYMTSECKE